MTFTSMAILRSLLLALFSTAATPIRLEEPPLRDGRQALRSLVNNASRLEAHVRELSRTAALAGTAASMRHVDYVENFWRRLGFRVARRTYEVPLSYFEDNVSPGVSICRDTACRPLELDKPLTQEDEVVGNLSPAFFTYSRPLNGEFGLLSYESIRKKSESDLASLLPGNLVLIRPNETILMSLMPLAAEINNNTGFLYVCTPPGEDDAEEVPREATAEPAYPVGIGAPDTAVTFQMGGPPDAVGDPTTPGYPSLWYATRREPGGSWEASLNVSMVPISVADAEVLADAFFAPKPPGSSDARLRIRWPLKFGYRQVHDSCAELPGTIEPDRVVLLGSHRDAWFGGAMDPHTGIATMLETGRALAELVKTTGWRPRRTILMCAWDAEESGLMGSVEWVEEEYLRAGARLVAYFNTDTDILGNWKILVQASDQMVDTLDSVLSEADEATGSNSSRHFFYKLDEQSDYFAFTRALGVPAADLSYVRGPRETLTLYDLYHTRYETPRLYKMLDPSGEAHLHLTQCVAALVYTFAESPLLPLNMSAFAEGLEKRLFQGFFQDEEDGESGSITEQRVKREEKRRSGRAAEQDGERTRKAEIVEVRRKLLPVARSALDNATQALHRFEEGKERLSESGGGSELRLRMLNDKMMLAQKAFTHHCVFPCEGTSLNLLDGLPAGQPAERIAQAIILGLNSMAKILSDSFVDED